jgi:hypothetical protein
MFRNYEVLGSILDLESAILTLLVAFLDHSIQTLVYKKKISPLPPPSTSFPILYLQQPRHSTIYKSSAIRIHDSSVWEVEDTGVLDSNPF